MADIDTKCVVCRVIMIPPIYGCMNMHGCCADCRIVYKTCICGRELNSRAPILEAISVNIVQYCRYVPTWKVYTHVIIQFFGHIAAKVALKTFLKQINLKLFFVFNQSCSI